MRWAIKASFALTLAMPSATHVSAQAPIWHVSTDTDAVTDKVSTLAYLDVPKAIPVSIGLPIEPVLQLQCAHDVRATLQLQVYSPVAPQEDVESSQGVGFVRIDTDSALTVWFHVDTRGLDGWAVFDEFGESKYDNASLESGHFGHTEWYQVEDSLLVRMGTAQRFLVRYALGTGETITAVWRLPRNTSAVIDRIRKGCGKK